MEFKDYYKIMNVSSEASADEIKRAYRKLARKYHPDVSKEKNAEENFKQVNEAYEVLKDAEKRKAYDRLRQGGWQGGQEFTPPPNWHYERASRPGGFEESGFADASEFSDFFESLFGGSFRQARGRSSVFRARGQDLSDELSISLEEAYRGGMRTLQLSVPEMDEQGRMKRSVRTLQVKIPAGVTEGQQIRLQGQGGQGVNGGPPGDLYLKIHILRNEFYALENRDVILSLPIAPWEAALGAKVLVPTLGGKIELKIPANSQTGTKLRLKGRGLPGNPSGDQYIILQIAIPPTTSEEAKTLYQQMAKEMPFNPRAKLGV